jgi:hypothetical protein
MFEQWIVQAVASCEACQSYSWMLITRRDRRAALVTVPFSLFRQLCPRQVRRKLRNYVVFQMDHDGDFLKVAIMPLDLFMANVSPRTVRRVYQAWQKAPD